MRAKKQKANPRFQQKQKGRFMPPAAFTPGRGIPKTTDESPMFKRGGKVRLKKGSKSHG